MQDDRGWNVAVVECRMCGNRHTAVFPDGTDMERMECAKCGHMTCGVVEIRVGMHLCWSWTCPRCDRLNVSRGNTVTDLSDEEQEAIGEACGITMAEEVTCAGCFESWGTQEVPDGPR